MNRRTYVHALFCILLASCLANKKIIPEQAKEHIIRLDTLNWFDSSRNRLIPVAIYTPADQHIAKKRLVIFSHGYGQNKGGDYTAYSYLTENLAAKGYFVLSIQHELATDSLMPSAGIPQVVRRPFWQRGVDNILFVMNELKKFHPELDFERTILIGHSNGADMTALFAQEYPDLVDKIITLDNRRMPLPRAKRPKVLSLRSSDQPADDGVLPTTEEQKKMGMKIIRLPHTMHNDMDDHANPAQRKEINDFIVEFLYEQG